LVTVGGIFLELKNEVKTERGNMNMFFCIVFTAWLCSIATDLFSFFVGVVTKLVEYFFYSNVF